MGKETITANIDISELKDKLEVETTPFWKDIPIVYAMLGWILTLGGGAFFTLSLLALAYGGWYKVMNPEGMLIYSILTILTGAILTGLSHVEQSW